MDRSVQRLVQGAVVELTANADRGPVGVTTTAGRELLVPGLFAGERARVRIVHVGKRQAQGKLLEVLTPHAKRRIAPCVRQDVCTGCPRMTLTPDGQRQVAQGELAELGIVPDRWARGDATLGYRWSAKRVVSGRVGAVVLGSYKRGSHHVADMRGCRVDHPAITAAADQIAETASALAIEPYDEASGNGDLRYVWLKANHAGQVLVTLVSGNASATRAPELGAALADVAGVAWCTQEGSGNRQRGRAAEHIAGLAELPVRIADVDVSVGPLGFMQPNPEVAALAYAELIGPDQGAVAFDLYAGAGVTTLLSRRHYDTVLACETNPESAGQLGVEPQTAADFLRAAPADVDQIIANPPRAGFGAEVCELLAARSRPGLRLNIMSCHPVSLRRDLDRLAEHYEITSIAAFETLPQTAHVELVCRLVGRPT